MSRLLVCILILLSIPSLGQQKEFKTLTAEEFKTKLEANKSAVLLDLRTDDELKNGVIPGATQLDYFKLDFEEQIKKLDKNKTYFLYCAVGGRSSETLELMKANGFTKVYHLKDGFNGWKKKNYPVEAFKN